MANIDFHQRTSQDVRADPRPDAIRPFSETHADLLDMFERWEVLADTRGAPPIDVLVRTQL